MNSFKECIISDVYIPAKNNAIQNEAVLKQRFLECVKNLLENMGVPDNRILEESIKGRRSDVRIGRVVIEFENPNRGIDPGINQIIEYVRKYRDKYGGSFYGLVTDGTKVVFVDSDGTIVASSELNAALDQLEELLKSHGFEIADPEDILHFIAPQTSFGREFIDVLVNELKKILSSTNKTYDKILRLYEGWQKIYLLSSIEGKRGSKEEEVQVFAKQTYLVILVKLIIFKILAEKGVIKEDSYASIMELIKRSALDGYRMLHNQPLMKGIIEEGAFDWFIDAARIDAEFRNRVSKLLAELGNLVDSLRQVSYKDRDIIRILYQGIFTPDERKRYGEFYTREDIVDEILDYIGLDEHGVIRWASSLIRVEGRGKAKRIIVDGKPLIDPACGSGTFLVRIISRVINVLRNNMRYDNRTILNFILENIIGYDINPFAVMLARANYLLAISTLLEGLQLYLTESIQIPVYWADSVSRPTVEAQKFDWDKNIAIKVYSITLPVLGKLRLPDPRHIDWQKLFSLLSKASIEDWSLEVFKDESKKTFGTYADVYGNTLTDLYNVFVRDKMNSKWLSLLKNTLAIESYQGKASFVVGNPPWVRIHLAKDVIIALKERYRVLQSSWIPGFKKTRVDTRSQHDYSLVFVEAGLDMLMPGGKLGYVITSKIATALYAGPLRRMLVEDTKIILVKDYGLYKKKLFEDATNYPLILVVEKAKPQKEHTVKYILVNTEGDEAIWSIEQERLPFYPHDKASPWIRLPTKGAKVKIGNKYIVFNDIDLALTLQVMTSKYPRIGDIYEVSRGVFTGANDIFFVTEILPTDDPEYVLVKTEIMRRNKEKYMKVRRKWIRPLLKGEDIQPLCCEPTRYILWIYNSDMELDQLDPQKDNELIKYFGKFKNRLVKRDGYRKNMPLWVVFRVKKNMKHPKVIWREISKEFAGCVLPSFDKEDIVLDHKVYYIPVSDVEETRRLACILYSSLSQAVAKAVSNIAHGGYFNYYAWVVGLMPYINVDVAPSVSIRCGKDRIELIRVCDSIVAAKLVENKLFSDKHQAEKFFAKLREFLAWMTPS